MAPKRTKFYKSMPSYKEAMYENHQKFLHQELAVSDIVGGDSKFAYIKAVLYFIFVPYIVGTVTMLVFTAKGNLSDIFLVIANGEFMTFFMLWAIGYEILATMFLIWVVYNIFSYNHEAAKKRAKRYDGRSSGVKFKS